MNRKIDYSKHLFRCSGLHHIMSGTIGLTDSQEIRLAELDEKKTKKYELSEAQKKKVDDYQNRVDNKLKISENQLKELKELQEKDGKVIGLTDSMQEEYNSLIEKRDNKELTDGIKNYLVKLHRQVTWNRRKRLETKYIKKGLQMEEDAITMYSLLTETPFINNTERVSNKYITGEYDIYLGRDIKKIKKGFDTKVSWDFSTFPYPNEKLNTVYEWQNHGYMFLSGAKSWTTVYCLMNSPKWALETAKYREGFEWQDNIIPKWKLLEILNNNIYDEETFYKLAKEWECIPDPSDESMDNIKAVDIFNNFVPLSLEERICEKTTERSDKAIEEIKLRVELSRKFLLTL